MPLRNSNTNVDHPQTEENVRGFLSEDLSEVRRIANGDDPEDAGLFWNKKDRLLAAAASYLIDDLPLPIDLMAALDEEGVLLRAVVHEGRTLKNLISEIEGVAN